MAEEEQEVEVTKLSNKVLIQLKKALGMSAEEKFEARKMAAAAAGATGKAVKVGGAAMVGGIKGMFSGIGKLFKSGWWLAIFPLFTAAKWMIGGFGKILGIFKGGSILKAFKWMLKPFFWIASIWMFVKGWTGAKDLNNDNVISYAEKFYQGLGKIVEFFTFGWIQADDAGKMMMAWSKAFANAILDPVGSWEKVTNWWNNEFKFKEDVVDPMVLKFNEFKASEYVEKIGIAWDEVTNWWNTEFKFKDDVVKPIVTFFQDTPDKIYKNFKKNGLFKFKKGMGDAFWNMMFGTTKDGEDVRSGGFIGAVKNVFSANNVVEAIAGTGNIVLNMTKGIGSLMRYILIGKGASYSDASTWSTGSYWGFMREKLTPKQDESIFGNVSSAIGSIFSYIGNIFTQLIVRFGRTVLEEIYPDSILGLPTGKGELLKKYDQKAKKVLKMLEGAKPDRTMREGYDGEGIIHSLTTGKSLGKPGGKTHDFSLDKFLKPGTGTLDIKKLLEYYAMNDPMYLKSLEKKDDTARQGKIDKWAPFYNTPLNEMFKKGVSSEGLAPGMYKLAERAAEYMYKFGVMPTFTDARRTLEEQKQRMIERKDSLGGKGTNFPYRLANTDLLSPEERDAEAGSPARIRGVEKLWGKGVGKTGSHVHGMGLDMRLPGGVHGKANFLISAFEKMGIMAKVEGDHLHLEPLGDTPEERAAALRLFSDKPQLLMRSWAEGNISGMGDWASRGYQTGTQGPVIIDGSTNSTSMNPILNQTPHPVPIESGSYTPGSVGV
jgi:hypothetical protein